MNNSNFRDLIDSLKDLTSTQKRYLISRTKMSLDDENGILRTDDLLTQEELEALLTPTNTTESK
ncbi:hypothetical protein [Vibrio sp. STUT-A11]|uniref:hypothetical protein n=1 Tax=unclassified Vibrio TaxID=2614977 RepID=UPI002230D231|nr:hypothetical protein [Vibrio sp. STUT-A11]